jgi:hypothetical protein
VWRTKPHCAAWMTKPHCAVRLPRRGVEEAAPSRCCAVAAATRFGVGEMTAPCCDGGAGSIWLATG